MNKSILTNRLTFLISLPSVMLGAIAMYFNDVPILIWSQNIIILLLAGLISFLVLSREPKHKRKTSYHFSIPIIIILLLLTFFDSGLGGVHRWMTIGPVKFYISSIVLPILLIELWNTLRIKNLWIPTIIVIVISILLTLQPDASQSTAFIISSIVLLWSKINNNIYRISITGVLTTLVIISWFYLDNLPPVAYVEEIVSLLGNMGIMWLVLGITSIVILPLPFILFPPRSSKPLSICLGTYYFIILISTLFGNFPVPLMGYGISPIIGYFISITWLVKTNNNS